MVYLFYGEDQFSLSEEVKRLKADNIPAEAEDFNFAKIDALKSGFTLDDVINTADAFPFLSDKRVVVVSGLLAKLGKSAAAEERAAARPNPKPAKGRSGSASATPTSPRDRFLNYLTSVPTSTILVLTEEKAAKNDAIYKVIDKNGAVREFAPLKDWALEKWISEHAASLGIKLDRAVPGLLREYLGGDLHRLHNELQKLAAYAGEGQPVTPEMVERMTALIQETQVWGLTDALAKCDLRTALTLLNRMRQESTLTRSGFTRQIFAMICKQIYDLIRIREMHAARKTPNEIAQTTGMHPYRLEKMLPLTRNFGAERLDRLYARLTELDYADKTGRADLNIQLELLLAEICQK